MIQMLVGGFLRHTMTTFGGSLAATGLLTEDEVTSGIGAVMVLFGLAWSAYQKHKMSKNTPKPMKVNE